MPTLTLPSASLRPILLTTTLTLPPLFLLLRSVLCPASPKDSTPTPSPQSTLLPTLSPFEITSLPYPPDFYPGARDVRTPYGRIRAYEFGPEGGKKVLFVHGISTSSPVFWGLAWGLVEKGYRVLLFDLPGRGYSEAVLDLPHDSRMYTSIMLYVLASSPLNWLTTTSSSSSLSAPPSSEQGIHIIGYSLGGAHSTVFTTQFPALVSSLTLLAPAGLLRIPYPSLTSRLLYPSNTWLPDWLVRTIVKGRMGGWAWAPSWPWWRGRWSKDPKAAAAGATVENHGYISPVPTSEPEGLAEEAATSATSPSSSPAATATATAPARDQPPPHPHPQQQRSRTGPPPNIPAIIAHQLQHHTAFIPSFISSMRHAPLSSQTTTYALLAPLLKPLIIVSTTDPIVKAAEYVPDATAALGGPEHLEVRVLEGGGHEFAFTRAEEVVALISSRLAVRTRAVLGSD
ncbi:MAG: hypothetical protein M1819_003014 [Sarea resinae]|nr:MAG: hypothetical protein M1819_003014 [Sarea resinae]